MGKREGGTPSSLQKGAEAVGNNGILLKLPLVRYNWMCSKRGGLMRGDEAGERGRRRWGRAPGTRLGTNLSLTLKVRGRHLRTPTRSMFRFTIRAPGSSPEKEEVGEMASAVRVQKP